LQSVAAIFEGQDPVFKPDIEDGSMYALFIVLGALYLLLLALAPFFAIPSRVWGVILTGFLIEYLFPGLPDLLVLLLTCVFGLAVWMKSRNSYC